MVPKDSRLQAAQQAIDSIGLGFDLNQDLYFDNVKRGSRLVLFDENQCHDLNIPGGVSIPNVPNSIKCIDGESIRLYSPTCPLRYMLLQFNQEMGLAGDTASGHFRASFGLSDRSIKDFGTIKSLAFHGWFIKNYTVKLEGYKNIKLRDHVKAAVPSSWDSEALARFIEQFGTHVIIGVTMGGKDVLYLREELPSNLHPAELERLLKDRADMTFMDSVENHNRPPKDYKNIVVMNERRGGSTEALHHRAWLDTIHLKPDVISMILLSLTSLLNGIHGVGFLSCAINRYLLYKPPIKDLPQFFDFMMKRRWAPLLEDITLRFHWRYQADNWLQFSFLGPKLYVNTIPVDVGNRPVTGLRLHLEGRRRNRLAIHLQHLGSLPKSFALSENASAYLSCESYNCNSHKKVKWNCFARVCTAPVESDDNLSIVTGAQLQINGKCLFLRLRFSKLIGATLQKEPEWDKSPSPMIQISQESGRCFLSFCSKREQKNNPNPLMLKPGEVIISSSPYISLPVPVNTPKLHRFVDTRENTRGPEDTPGSWVVSGARLSVQNEKICLIVKYSLFSFVTQSGTKT